MSSAQEDLRPPLLPVTDYDHGAWVITVSTILLILTILATVITTISRLKMTRKLAWNDIVLVLGCVGGISDKYLLDHQANSSRHSLYPKLSA